MTARLGRRQIELITMMGPRRAFVVADAKLQRLEALGLVDCGKADEPGGKGFCCLTPAGLRKLADLIEAGTVPTTRERIIADAQRRTNP